MATKMGKNHSVQLEIPMPAIRSKVDAIFKGRLLSFFMSQMKPIIFHKFFNNSLG